MGVGLAIDRPLKPPAAASHRGGWASTWRLLAIAMPLGIAAVALLGWWVAGLDPRRRRSCSGPSSRPPTRCWHPTCRWKVPRTRAASPKSRRTTRSGSRSPRRPGSTTLSPSRSCTALFMIGNEGADRAVDRAVGRLVADRQGRHRRLGWIAGDLFGPRGLVPLRRSTGHMRLAERSEPIFALAAHVAVYGLTELAGRIRLSRRLRLRDVAIRSDGAGPRLPRRDARA